MATHSGLSEAILKGKPPRDEELTVALLAGAKTAADVLNQGMDIPQPELVKADEKPLAKIIIATVKG